MTREELEQKVSALEAENAEVEQWIPDATGPYQSLGERTKLLKDQLEYATESGAELGRALKQTRQERDALKAENKSLNGDMKVAIEAEKHRIELIKENVALEEQVARLTAPVSDEERVGWFSFFGDLNAYLASDHDVESLIASRASQKEEQP